MCCNGKMTMNGLKVLLTFVGNKHPQSKDFFQSDEGIYTLITDGVPINVICNCISLSSVTIEHICLRYINELDYKNKEEGIEKLFKIKGLPKIDMVRLYINSKLNEKDFLKMYNLSWDKWHNILRAFDFYDYIQSSIKEKEERITRRSSEPGVRVVAKNWYSHIPNLFHL